MILNRLEISEKIKIFVIIHKMNWCQNSCATHLDFIQVAKRRFQVGDEILAKIEIRTKSKNKFEGFYKIWQNAW